MDIELQPLIKSLSFGDIDEPASRIKTFQWNMEHRQIERGVFDGDLIIAQFAEIQFARITYSRGIRSFGNSPAGMITIGVPLSPAQLLKWHGYSVSMDQVILQKSSHGIDFLRKGAFPMGIVSVDIDSLLNAADLTTQSGIESVVLGKVYVIQPDGKALQRFCSYLQTVFTLMQQNPQQFLSPDRQNLIRQESLLLMLDICNASQNSSTPHPLTHYKLMKKAEELLMDNRNRPLTIYDLCTQLHVSERTLHYSFQKSFGMPPMTYLKIQRLNGVRLQLKKSMPTETTVADVASQWGFWHMGQFSTDYKKMFGDSPSETLRHS